MFARIALLVIACSACSPLPGPPGSSAPPGRAEPPIASAPVELPLSFIENRGQIPNADVAHYVKTPAAAIGFTPAGLRIGLSDSQGTSQVWGLSMDFVGGRAQPVAESLREGVVSYFTGDRSDWRTSIPTHGRLVYRDLWPGIDLVYRTERGSLKYELLVHPGADPGDIRLRWRGATGVGLRADGSLEVRTPAGTLVDGAPVSFQGADDVRTEYLLDGRTVAFDVGPYDAGRTLVIDPVVTVYAGFIGGTTDESGNAIAVDASGAVYVGGETETLETSFPETTGPDLTYGGGASDAFIAKVNPQGTALVYAGYIGGDGEDDGFAIAVDSSGSAYIAGATNSTFPTFPRLVGPSTVKHDLVEGFVTKVNPQGTGLVYSGYIGGDMNDVANGIALDPAGAAYVTGKTNSPAASFPVTGGPDPTFNSMGSEDDAFVAKVKPDGSGLQYAGYVGGAGFDRSRGIAVDGSGAAYVTGTTFSSEVTFPDGDGFGGIGGPDQIFDGGADDAFVAKVRPDGSGLQYAGYIGGGGSDVGGGVAVDGSGAAYLTGGTSSSPPSFPANVGPFLSNSGGEDAYVGKLNAAGTAFVYLGYIGGTALDGGSGIVVDGAGSALIVGFTESDETTFPEMVGPDLTFGGGGLGDGFVAKVNPAGTGLTYAGYLGGSGFDEAIAIALDPTGAVYMTGFAEAAFPVTFGPDLTHNGGVDAFVVKVTDNLCLGKGVTIQGTGGNDALIGTASDDVILGLAGDDTIDGAGGNDTICAGDGNDVLIGGAGDDRLDGEAGTDTASFPGAAGVSASLVTGAASGLGADTLAGLENLTGSAAKDTLTGDASANVIKGGGGDDTAFGGDGDDELQGEAGKDRLVGQAGNDLLVGGAKADRLSGGGGKDRLRGQGGKDRLSGGGANDRLAGGKGNDRMNGGKGKKDRCNGGKGTKDTATKCETVTGVP